MTEEFNPYREWLGLDRQVERPDYYQLLGISRAESDAAAITAAADRALARVRSCRPGPHAGRWSQLLEEITAAKRCLTDPRLRAAYDGRPAGGVSPRPLRPAPRPTGRPASPASAATRAGPKQPPAVPVTPRIASPAGPAALPTAIPVASAAIPAAPVAAAIAPAARPGVPVVGTSRGPAPRVAARRRRRSNSLAFLAATVGTAMLLIALGLLLMLTLGSRKSASPAGSAPPPAAPDVRHPPAATADTPAPRPAEPEPSAVAESSAAPPAAAGEDNTSPQVEPGETGAPPQPTEPVAMPPVFGGEEPQLPPTGPQDPPASPVVPAAPAVPAEEPVEPAGVSAEPPSTEPTQAEQRAVAEALTAARTAAFNQQYDRAVTILEEIESSPMTPEQFARYERLSLLAQYARNFDRTFREALGALQSGDDIPVNSTVTVGVVEAGGGQLTLRVSGENRVYASDRLPPGLVLAIADQRLSKSDPVSLVMKAAYLATLDPSQEQWRSKAREWFQQAAAQGAQIGDLHKVLDD